MVKGKISTVGKAVASTIQVLGSARTRLIHWQFKSLEWSHSRGGDMENDILLLAMDDPHDANSDTYY